MNRKKNHYTILKKILLIAFIATLTAFLCKIFLVQYYNIPTDSMSKTILIDDGVFVSKLHYGAMVLETRLPGFSSIKRLDIVVFNDPKNKGQFLIKRLIGLPGDTLCLRHQKIFINNRGLNDPPKSMSIYLLKTKTGRQLDKLVQNDQLQILNRTDSNSTLTLITSEIAESLKQATGTINLTAEEETKPDHDIYPSDADFGWNRDNYGPIVIPKKGQKIPLTYTNYLLYRKIIEEETGKSLKLVNNKVLLDDMLTNTITIKKNYYFMIGDNRSNSKDSRYFGFIAQDQIIGKALIKISSKPKKLMQFTFL
ncbi:signal peptidase I [Pedobacter sp. UYP24]